MKNLQSDEIFQASQSVGDFPSAHPGISGNGRYVTFHTVFAINENPYYNEDELASAQSFLYDVQSGATTRISTSPGGRPGDAVSVEAAISGQGNFIAFASNASNFAHRRSTRACSISCG